MPRLHRRTVYIETVVRAERQQYAHNATPPDFKFFMFGKTVGSVAIIAGRKTADACMAWVDEDFKRTDLHGCVCREVSKLSPCSYRHCDTNFPPKPTQWESMVRLARRLGSTVGVHMRIDLFASASGVPTLGEFTPWHSNGKMHCDMRPLNPSKLVPGATRRRQGVTGETHWIDMCRLGRQWSEAGAEEGGQTGLETPAVLRGWPALMYNERSKCMAATKMLKPTSWATTIKPSG